MKRDWNLIRQILLKLEEEPDELGIFMPSHFPDYDEGVVGEHIKLVCESPFVNVSIRKDDPNNVDISITFEGYEFLENVCSDLVWEIICKTAHEKNIPLTTDSIRQLSIKAWAEFL